MSPFALPYFFQEEERDRLQPEDLYSGAIVWGCEVAVILYLGAIFQYVCVML